MHVCVLNVGRLLTRTCTHTHTHTHSVFTVTRFFILIPQVYKIEEKGQEQH